MKRPSRSPGRRVEQGAVLVVGLIFLAMLTLIGVAAYSVATQEERMSGNSRDRTIALEAAEAALRECEAMTSNPATQYSQTGGVDPNGRPGGFYDKINTVSGLSWADPGFVPPAGGALNYHVVKGVSQGNGTNAQCIAEIYTADPGMPTAFGKGTQTNWPRMARVTAQGFGLNPSTTVKLQSNYLR